MRIIHITKHFELVFLNLNLNICNNNNKDTDHYKNVNMDPKLITQQCPLYIIMHIKYYFNYT